MKAAGPWTDKLADLRIGPTGRAGLSSAAPASAFELIGPAATYMTGDVYDYAPPAWIRWTETFWSLHGPTLDRDQTGLEVGCYRGETLLRLSPFIGRITGIESDAADLAKAAARTAGRPGIATASWDGGALPFEARTFDVVFVDLARPGFLPRDRSFLFAEARRVLKPEGRFLAIAFRDSVDGGSLRGAWTDRLAQLGAALGEPPPLFAAEKLAAEIASAGLEPRVETLGPLLEVLGDAPGGAP